jgi:ATP-binding cassette subfamily B protein
VRENIVFGRPWIAEQDVVAAAERAQIARDVQRLPSGYGTLLGNGGSGLSGGQRQRLALARALAGDPGLLVLDEATSALDPVTERAVHAALAELGCTRVVVAHRLSTVTAADRVLVLDDGRLVDDGSYAAVRQRSSVFRALLRADGRTGSADPATPQTGRHR